MINEAAIEEDKFDLSLRILGNEVLGMSLTSKSRWKNWAMFGTMILILLIALAEVVTPLIISLANIFGMS